MSDEGPKPIQKKVDERWKEDVERERHLAATAPAKGAAKPSEPARPEPPPPPRASPPPHPAEPAPRPDPEPSDEEPAPGEPNFAVFLSSLSMQAMMALGELPLPGTNQRHEDLDQARYLIDILTLLQQKTKGNLTAEESQFLEGALYELRLRYTQKVMPPIPPPPGGRR